MGCCQSKNETGEVLIAVFKEKLEELPKSQRIDGEFAEVSLRSSSEESTVTYNYTDIGKAKDLFFTLRSTTFSLHKTELEQSFSQTRSLLLN